MKDFREMDELVFEFGEHIKKFTNNHGGIMPPAIKTQLQDLMFTSFAKEIEAITEREQIEIKYKKRFYDKLLKAKMKLAKLDRADAWFDKVFQKYFNRGILEHLLVYGIKFLYNKDLFVPRRLFVQINNDELLGQFVVAACDYLGWTSQNEPVEQATTDETETAVDEQQDKEESAVNDEDAAQAAECTDVTVYEPKEIQPIEQQAQSVVKVERTVTHEVMTATPGAAMSTTETSDDAVTNSDETAATSLQSSQSVPPFYRPGGKNAKKS